MVESCSEERGYTSARLTCVDPGRPYSRNCCGSNASQKSHIRPGLQRPGTAGGKGMPSGIRQVSVRYYWRRSLRFCAGLLALVGRGTLRPTFSHIEGKATS